MSVQVHVLYGKDTFLKAILGKGPFVMVKKSEMEEILGCAKATCAKIIKELDSEKGIGLIEKKRRGLGRPDIIYVKNFALSEDEKPDSDAANTDKHTEVQKLYFWKFSILLCII